MQKHQDHRCFDRKLKARLLESSESETQVGRERKIERKYVLAASAKGPSGLEAVACTRNGPTSKAATYNTRTFWRRGRSLTRSSRGRRSTFSWRRWYSWFKDSSADGFRGGRDPSPARALRAFSTARQACFRLEGQPERRGIAGGCHHARRALKVLRIVDQGPPIQPQGEDTVI
jgi:hypothetical protein